MKEPEPIDYLEQELNKQWEDGYKEGYNKAILEFVSQFHKRSVELKDIEESAKVVEKKILPEYFKAIIEEKKHFEIRKDEDNLQIGDILILKEWNGKEYTGQSVSAKITYVLRNAPEYGLMEGYIIVGW